MGFTDPFPGLTKPLRDGDLVRALRLDLAAEEDAINLYSSHIDASNDAIIKAALTDIVGEERTHAGEILRLIGYLTEDEQDFILKGYEEINRKFPKIKYGISKKE
jgi:rubrerythrin